MQDMEENLYVIAHFQKSPGYTLVKYMLNDLLKCCSGNFQTYSQISGLLQNCQTICVLLFSNPRGKILILVKKIPHTEDTESLDRCGS